jgi:hypothetical protein
MLGGGAAGVAGGGGMAGGAVAGGGGTAGGAMAGGGGMAGGLIGDGGIAAGGGTGTIQVLSDDAAALLGPTTAAIVDDTVWVAIGQLAELFQANPNPARPIRAVAIPLAGGPVGAEAIEFPGNPPFFPEGITASGAGELFIGSVTRGLITRVAPSTVAANPFMGAGVAERGVIGMDADDDRNILWFCDSNPDPVTGTPGGALVGISLTTPTNVPGDVIVRHELPDNLLVLPGGPDAGVVDAGEADASATQVVPAFCNDVLVLPDGDLLVSDSSGRIFRVESEAALVDNSAEVWLSVPEIAPPEPGGFGANGLDLIGESLIIANGSLVQVDPASEDPASTVRVLSLSENGATASLGGPPGLATVPGSDTEMVVVENGSCAAGVSRVIKVTLDLN